MKKLLALLAIMFAVVLPGCSDSEPAAGNPDTAEVGDEAEDESTEEGLDNPDAGAGATESTED